MEKTKAQLQAELKQTREQLAAYDRMEQYRTGADEVRLLFGAFVNAGFTEEQAMNIVLTALRRIG